MKPKYCYWSVCDGECTAMMEHCARTTRAAGVFRDFNVLCDRPIEGCQCSPIHVPLELDLSVVAREAEWNGVRLGRLGELLRAEGVMNQVYLSGSAFWIVHHDVIDMVYDLALGFWHKAKETGWLGDVSAGLGYAMQILCGDPEAHLLERHPELWAGDFEGRQRPSDGGPWLWRHPSGGGTFEVRPAIAHVPGPGR